MATLDEVLQHLGYRGTTVLLKIDTQGHETHGLNGAKAALRWVELIEIELSLQPMYEGQELWLELGRRLASAGFELIGVEPVFTDAAPGYMLQIDGLFRRQDRRIGERS